MARPFPAFSARLVVHFVALAVALSALGPFASTRAEAAEPTPLLPWIDGSLRFEMGARDFSYSDPITSNLRPYDIVGAPTIAASLEAFPLALTYVPIIRQLGITGLYARALGLTSSTEGGEAVSTTWDRLRVGLHQRMPLRPDLAVGVRGAFALSRFHFEDAPPTLEPELPDVTYKGYRFGIDGRLWLDPWVVTADVGYHLVSSGGAAADRHRDPKIHGFDAGFCVSRRLYEGLDGRFEASYERYAYAFEPVPGDAYVAGGALDQMLHVGLGVGFSR